MLSTIRTAARALLLAAALSRCAVVAAADAKTYTIRFDHPATKGEKHRVEVVVASLTSWRTSWNGENPVDNEQASGVHLIGDSEALEIDKDGRVQKLSINIVRCTTTSGKSETQLLPAGSKVIARTDGSDTRFTVDGRTPSKAVRAWLTKLIPLHSEEDRDDLAEYLGPSNPVRVSDSWPINPEIAADRYIKWGWRVKEENVTGTGKLTGIEECNDEPCLKIEIDLKIKDLMPPPSKSRGKVNSSEMTIHETWLIPVDPAKPVQSRTASRTMKYEQEGTQEGRSYSGTQSDQEERQYRLLPLPQPPTTQPQVAPK